MLQKLYHLQSGFEGVRIIGDGGGTSAGAVTATAGAAAIRASSRNPKPAAQNDPNGGSLPPYADESRIRSPMTPSDRHGKAVFKDKCQRCHGPGGRRDARTPIPPSRTT